MTIPGFDVTVRHDLRPGDVDAVVGLHVDVYCDQLGFDRSFATHVSQPLSRFAETRTARDRIWLVERGARLVGCVAVVHVDDRTAQLRWFVLRPEVRGLGLGRWLLQEAVGFARSAGYGLLFLWTVNALTVAACLYRSVGFRLTVQSPGGWAPDMVEERYELTVLSPGG